MTEEPRTRADRTPRRRLDATQRQSAILDAAAAAFAAAAYPQVRIEDIALTAGASPALVFRYFGTKAELYAAVVARWFEELADRQRAAAAELPERTARRERMRVALLVYLDHVAASPGAWGNPMIVGEEPREVHEVRAAARARQIAWMRDLLQPTDWSRHDFALVGFTGFVDAVTLAWVQAGCPDDQRHAAVDSALGALQGALGDWGG